MVMGLDGIDQGNCKRESICISIVVASLGQLWDGENIQYSITDKWDGRGYPRGGGGGGGDGGCMVITTDCGSGGKHTTWQKNSPRVQFTRPSVRGIVVYK